MESCCTNDNLASDYTESIPLSNLDAVGVTDTVRNFMQTVERIQNQLDERIQRDALAQVQANARIAELERQLQSQKSPVDPVGADGKKVPADVDVHPEPPPPEKTPDASGAKSGEAFPGGRRKPAPLKDPFTGGEY